MGHLLRRVSEYYLLFIPMADKWVYCKPTGKRWVYHSTMYTDGSVRLYTNINNQVTHLTLINFQDTQKRGKKSKTLPQRRRKNWQQTG